MRMESNSARLKWGAALLTMVGGLLLLVTDAGAANHGRLVSVLPLNVSDSSITKADRIALEEEIRTTAGELLGPSGRTVLTEENTLRLLEDNGVDPSRVCDASCALDAARELKAELFLSGTVTTSEGSHLAFIRLFESKRGTQLSALKLEGTSVRDLREQFERRASELFNVLDGVDLRSGNSPAKSDVTTPVEAPAPPLQSPPVKTDPSAASLEVVPTKSDPPIREPSPVSPQEAATTDTHSDPWLLLIFVLAGAAVAVVLWRFVRKEGQPSSTGSQHTGTTAAHREEETQASNDISDRPPVPNPVEAQRLAEERRERLRLEHDRFAAERLEKERSKQALLESERLGDIDLLGDANLKFIESISDEGIRQSALESHRRRALEHRADELLEAERARRKPGTFIGPRREPMTQREAVYEAVVAVCGANHGIVTWEWLTDDQKAEITDRLIRHFALGEISLPGVGSYSAERSRKEVQRLLPRAVERDKRLANGEDAAFRARKEEEVEEDFKAQIDQLLSEQRAGALKQKDLITLYCLFPEHLRARIPASLRKEMTFIPETPAWEAEATEEHPTIAEDEGAA